MLLVTSGVLTLAAAAQRWWPACRLGAFDDAPCPALQDSRYNYLGPSDPWTPLGVAAELQALALLPLALVTLLLPRVLAGRRPGRLQSTAALLVSADIAAVAVVTFLSGRDGQVVTIPGPWSPGILWSFGLPLLASVPVLLSFTAPDPPRLWAAGRYAAAGCVLLASPVAQPFVAPAVFAYTSYDSTPWGEAFGGVPLIGAAVFLSLAIRRDPVPGAADGSAPATRADTLMS